MNPLTAAATLGFTPKNNKAGILTKPAPTPKSPVIKPDEKAAIEIFKKVGQSILRSMASYL